jgi:hypothetical protein
MPNTIAPSSSSAELSHASIGQWGAVIAGVLGGFAATILMTTLGTALGLTVGAAAANDAAGLADNDATTLGGAAIAWLLVSAIVVGGVGGTVLARSARPDRSYHAGMLGLMSWTGGIVLAVLVAAPGAAGALSGLGNAGGAAAAVAGENGMRRATGMDRVATADPTADRGDVRPMDASATRARLSPEEQQRLRVAAEETARAASIAAWAALLAQVVSLIATIVAAKWMRRRIVDQEPVGYAMPTP